MLALPQLLSWFSICRYWELEFVENQNKSFFWAYRQLVRLVLSLSLIIFKEMWARPPVFSPRSRDVYRELLRQVIDKTAGNSFLDCLHLGLRACGSWWAGCSSHCLPDPSCWGGFQLSTWTPWQCWFKIGKMMCWCPFWCRTAPRPSPRCVSRPTPAATLSTGSILAMLFCISLWKYWKPFKVSRAALTPFW